MKCKRFCIFLALLLAFNPFSPLTSAASPPAQTMGLSDLTWLLGTWEAKWARSTIVEKWSRDEDGTLNGVSYSVLGNDSVITESTRIIADSTGLYFVATVPKNKGAMRFRLVSADSLGLHFENSGHDYPASVHYHLLSDDSLHAWIDSAKDGHRRRVYFRYRRVR